MTPRPDLDLAAEFARPDLRAIGLALFSAAHHRTDILWVEPDVDPAPLHQAAAEAGQVVGAVILVFGTEVTVAVHPAARPLRWFTTYVERVAQEIQERSGLEGFCSGEQSRGRRRRGRRRGGTDAMRTPPEAP